MDNEREDNKKEFIQYENLQEEIINNHNLRANNDETMSNSKKTLLLFLALFPLTGAFGIYSFLTKNDKLKKLHSMIDLIIAGLIILGFSPVFGCPVRSCAVTLGVVLVVASVPVAIVNYIASIVGAIIVVKKDGEKTSTLTPISISISIISLSWMLWRLIDGLSMGRPAYYKEYINSCYNAAILSIVLLVIAFYTKDRKNLIFPAIVLIFAIIPILIFG